MSRFDARITSKGQTTVPLEIRKLLGLDPGSTIQFIATGDGKVEVVAKRHGISHLKGLFGTPSSPVDIDATIVDAVAARTAPDRTEIDL